MCSHVGAANNSAPLKAIPFLENSLQSFPLLIHILLIERGALELRYFREGKLKCLCVLTELHDQ